MFRIDVLLKNKEGLTLLYSVVKHEGTSKSTKAVKGETRDVVECFSLVLFSKQFLVLEGSLTTCFKLS